MIPPDFVKKYEPILGSKMDKFLAGLETRRYSIRVNTLKTSVDWIKERLESYGWRLKRFSWLEYAFYVDSESPGATIEHVAGFYYVQSDSSMLPVKLLEPKPGELVLDIAASPGSKTTQMSQEMDNTGGILANDVSLDRISILYNNIKRFGALNVAVRKSDGRRIPGKEIFDKSLVDVPCSNEASIASIRTARNWSPEDRFSRLQKALLAAAVRLTREDGIITYSTCTFRPEENEEVIDWALANLPVKLEKAKAGMEHSRGLKGYECSDKVIRVWPWQGEGFFAAKLRKVSER